METVEWMTGTGNMALSPLVARFEADGVEYIVVRCGCGTYDPNPPFTVLVQDECVIHVD